MAHVPPSAAASIANKTDREASWLPTCVREINGENGDQVARTCGLEVSPQGVTALRFEVPLFMLLKLVHTTAHSMKKLHRRACKSIQTASLQLIRAKNR